MDNTRFEQKTENVSPLLHITEWFTFALEIVKIGGRDEDQVPGPETPRAIQDRPDRIGGDGHGKRA